MRCNRQTDTGGQAQRVCEVAQTIIIQGQQAPVAEVAIGRIKERSAGRNSGVDQRAFPSTPQISLTDILCLSSRGNAACRMDVSQMLRQRMTICNWRAAKTTGRIETKDAFGRNVVVTIPFEDLHKRSTRW
jgi:hypothetical protein